MANMATMAALVRQANVAHAHYNEAQDELNALIDANLWGSVEAARFKLVACFEAYVDALIVVRRTNT